jgi:hypothetical protein
VPQIEPGSFRKLPCFNDYRKRLYLGSQFFRRPFQAINNQGPPKSFCRLGFQSELLLQRCRNRWTCGVRYRNSIATAGAPSHSLLPLAATSSPERKARKFQVSIEEADNPVLMTTGRSGMAIPSKVLAEKSLLTPGTSKATFAMWSNSSK